MIREIEVENFQSLRRVRVRLGRFTVITGPTGTGKSAFIRALRLLAFNARGTQYITRGEKTTSVSAELDDSLVVTFRRGASEYAYLLGTADGSGKTFTKLAGKVPEQVTQALCLTDVNFAGQLDMPYLLNASGSDVARVLGKLTNFTLLFRAAQEANRRRLASMAELKTRQADLAALYAQIAQYATLPAEKAQVEAAESALVRVQEQQRRRERLDLLTAVAARNIAARDALSGQQFPEVPSLDRLQNLVARRGRLSDRMAWIVTCRRFSEQAYGALVEADANNHEADLALERYTSEWGVCPECGQPVHKGDA